VGFECQHRISAGGSLLTLEAGRQSPLRKQCPHCGGKRLGRFRLTAGADFSTPGKVKAGVGGIYFNGGPVNPGGQHWRVMDRWKPRTAPSICWPAMKSGWAAVMCARWVADPFKSKTLAGDVDAGLKPDYYQFSRQDTRSVLLVWAVLAPLKAATCPSTPAVIS